VESAVILSALLLILFGLLDFGLMALNVNNLADAAQQVARRAIVRGKNAASNFSVWGPTTYSGTAASGDEIASQAASSLVIMPRANVKITVEWPDGGCNEGQRVRATLTYLHPLVVPSLFGFPSRHLTAVSTMRIAN
jgi:Flp pilus assembly protein TadG